MRLIKEKNFWERQQEKQAQKDHKRTLSISKI